MITYTVRYKTKGMLLWREIKGVTADGIGEGPASASRWILCGDVRYEIPIAVTVFHFSKERMDLIRENMEQSGKVVAIGK